VLALVNGGDRLQAQAVVRGDFQRLAVAADQGRWQGFVLIVLRWLSDSPTEYGFPTDLWSAPRLPQLIDQEFGLHFHPHYLSPWLRQRGYTLQKPRHVSREQDQQAIAQCLQRDWPRCSLTFTSTTLHTKRRWCPFPCCEEHF
jgi:hypothetical protein